MSKDIPRLLFEALSKPQLEWCIQRAKRSRKRHFPFQLNDACVFMTRRDVIALAEKVLAEKEAA